MSDRNIRNILLVRTDRIGDVILTLPMAQAIRENFADAKVGFLARQYTAPILEISTYIDEILLRETPELAQKLREYDAAILVHPTPKDALALW